MSPPQKNVAGDMRDIVTEAVEYGNREDAISYSFRYYVQGMVKNKGIRLLKADGIEPSVENIRRDTYPISSPSYVVYVKGNADRNLKLFLSWIQSKGGKELTEKTGYMANSQPLQEERSDRDPDFLCFIHRYLYQLILRII